MSASISATRKAIPIVRGVFFDLTPQSIPPPGPVCWRG
jgi:hypothetical protein